MERDDSLQVVEGSAGLAAIRDDWRRIEAQLANPRFFHMAEFYEAYTAAYPEGDAAARFAVLREGAQARAIFPFRRTTRRLLGLPLRTIEFPAPWDLAADVLCLPDGNEPERVSRLFVELAAADRTWDYVELARVLTDSSAAALLRAPRGLPARAERVGGVFFLPLVPYEQMLRRYSDGFRRQLRKQHNHLLRIGDREFVRFDSLPGVEEAIERLMVLESAGWKGRAGTSILSQGEAAAAFYRNVARRLGGRGACRVYLLNAEGRTLGAQLCFLSGETCYMVKIAYDERYPKASPGQSLIQHILEECGSDPALKTINFCSDEAWMQDLRPMTADVLRLRLYRRSARGTIARLLFALKPLVRRLRSRSPAPASPLPSEPQGLPSGLQASAGRR
jgi:CelD/BcsL family acetyltransferase involved in cellulose biosynthesis